MKRHVPIATLEAQARASDPSRSAWVSANAGSGKTHVLARRVVRLLLQGTEPSRILCLTYTRAAAANMSNRVFRDLARWATLPDEELAAEIAAITGRPASREERDGARRLFAQALETPGGLKIQTIHAFCEAVLHQFPLEANIAGHFEMLDQQMEAALLAEARRDLIDGAADDRDTALAAAFADILASVGEYGLDELLSAILRSRNELAGFIGQLAGDPQPYASLFAEFGFAPDTTAAGLAAAAWPLPGFDPTFFRAFAEAARATGAGTVLNNILPHAEPAFAMDDPVARLEGVAAGFLKADGKPYGDSAFKRALVDRLPDLPDRYAATAEALVAARDRIATLSMVTATRSALTVADWLIGRYETLKRARGFLDFSDLITRTAALLAREEASAWVHYKLDRGIDHILLDEAQDTSPDQWQVVEQLAAEFFAGEGSRGNTRRTIFAVGDEKQSIYSFQGAEPAAFARSGRAFRERVAGAQEIFEEVRLTQSFRSTGDVLSAVDRVFATGDAARGLSYQDDPVRHDWIREREPGYVEVWQSLGPEAIEQPDDWTEAIDHASAPAVRLAETIADTIAGWIRHGDLLEGKGRPIRPGDVMVLVRKRDRFVHALSRALKQPGRRIPVAGADRLLLTDHIAVKDLLAIGRIVLQPHDDLSLAALLRSPIFAMTEDRLRELAVGRGESEPLFDMLRRAAGDDLECAAIVETLEEWRDAAAFRPVFEFYAGILAGTAKREGARARLIARLGEDAADILDEFLAFALAAERSGTVGLEGFIATMDTAAPEIKREMEHGRDQVRIMTVHAAKGLEAPIVFLVDPGSAPFSAQHQPLLLRFRPRQRLWEGDGWLWRAGNTKNDFARALGGTIGALAEEEYRRLLYVGMTRAEDRLIVCGYHGVKGRRADTWHAMVSAALAGAPEAEEMPGPEACRPVWRFRINPAEPVAAPAMQAGKSETAEPLPDLFAHPLPPAPRLPRPLRPSGAALTADEEDAAARMPRSPVLDPAEPENLAIARGTAIHRMLQLLPGLPETEREPAARHYLDLAGAEWPQQERDSALSSVIDILGDARFAALFRPGSRAEVNLMGTVRIGGQERAVAGKIDRLAVEPGRVLIVDYKTNRIVPDGIDTVPPAYIAQLALYRALLQPLYADRAVEAALLFTGAPVLMPIPAARMEAALAALSEA